MTRIDIEEFTWVHQLRAYTNGWPDHAAALRIAAALQARTDGTPTVPSPGTVSIERADQYTVENITAIVIDLGYDVRVVPPPVPGRGRVPE